MPKSYAFYVPEDDVQTKAALEGMSKRHLNLSSVIRRLLIDFAKRGFQFEPEDKNNDPAI
jgi:hypothetical protein